MKRLIFPLVNACALALLLGLLGYYLSDLLKWSVIGGLLGVVIGLIIEVIFKRLGEWLYRRRVLLVVLLEILLLVFVIGPYAYVVALAQPAQGAICCAIPADFGADYQSVSIPVADGVTLAGWFIAPTAEHGVTILLLHGAGGNRLGALWHAEQLARAGYGVLLYDQRALGESMGDRQSWGWLDARDLPYLLDFVAAQPGVNPDRMGGVGLSLGAHILITAAPDNPRLAALWLDGLGAGSMEDFPQPQNIGENFAWIINQRMLYSMAFHLNATPPPPVKTLIPRFAPRPLLLVVSPLDEFEYRINQGYTAFLGENAEQWIIEGAPHVGGPYVVPEEYTARMIAFFDKALVEDEPIPE